MMTARLRRLGLFVVAASCSVLVLGSVGASEAWAGDCDPMTGTPDTFQLGINNTCTAATQLTTTGSPGLRVNDATAGATAFSANASATAAANTWGIQGVSASSGLQSYGVRGELTTATPGTESAGVFGVSSSTNDNGYGVFGRHLATSGVAPGILGETMSIANGAMGVMGSVNPTSPGAASVGVLGFNRGTGGLGYGVEGFQGGSGYGGYFHVPGSGFGLYATAGNGGSGVVGEVASGANWSYGIFGDAKTNTAANSAGVGGRIVSNAANAAGVRGDNYSTLCCGMGVAGFHAGQGIGVYGEALNGFAVSGFSPNNWSGYFQGSVNVVGTLFKSSGAFRIDHPLDPAHKYLQHSFVESPDMMNVYNGNVTTNGKGFATVKLPDWFRALNKEFRYQLTVIDKAHWTARAAVWNKIKDNHFTIRTDQAHVQVSWQVTGIRHDAWANAHRIPVVAEKSASDQNKYVHPELYGKPMTKSVVVLPGMDGKGNSKLAPPSTKK